MPLQRSDGPFPRKEAFSAHTPLASLVAGMARWGSAVEAWFLLHRLREICQMDAVQLSGEVEIDETCMGGKAAKRRRSKQTPEHRGAVGKHAVMGMRERGGKTVAKPIEGPDRLSLWTEIQRTVAPGSLLYTDEHPSYRGITRKAYRHATVNHSAKEYVHGMAHTNGIESVWAVLKRGYQGVYHNRSAKHLHRYVNDFTFRLNEGHVTRHTLDRLDSLVSHAVGKRLTYAQLISS